MTNNWQIAKLGKYAKLQGGNAFKSSDYKTDGVPLVRIGNVGFGQYVKNSFVYLSNDEYERSQSFQLKNGDILVGMTGELGKVAKINNNDLPALLNQRVGRIQFLDSTLDKEYIYQLLVSEYFISKLTPFFVGAAQKNISSAQVEGIDIPIPINKVQKKIGDILSSIDEAIQKTVQIIQKSEELKSGLMNELLTKGIGHRKFKKTKLGEIPEEWEIVEMHQITHNITDGKHGDCENESDSGYYFISVKDIRNGVINYENARQITKADFEDTHRRTKLEAGDLLLTNSGTIGRMAVVPNNELTNKTTFQKSVAVIKPNPNQIDVHYLMYALTLVIKSLILESSGSAQVNLLLKDLRSYKVLLPKLEEQRIIAEIMSSTDIKIAKENKYKNELIKLKSALMHDIFNQKVQIN